jgi:hypothetical protein
VWGSGSHDLDCGDCRILGCEPLSLVEIYRCTFPYDGSVISCWDVQFHRLYHVMSQDTVLSISCGRRDGAFVGHSLYAHMYAESWGKAWFNFRISIEQFALMLIHFTKLWSFIWEHHLWIWRHVLQNRRYLFWEFIFYFERLKCI